MDFDKGLVCVLCLSQRVGLALCADKVENDGNTFIAKTAPLTLACENIMRAFPLTKVAPSCIMTASNV